MVSQSTKAKPTDKLQPLPGDKRQPNCQNNRDLTSCMAYCVLHQKLTQKPSRQARLCPRPKGEINESSKQCFGQADSFKEEITWGEFFDSVSPITASISGDFAIITALLLPVKRTRALFKNSGPNIEQRRRSFPPQLIGFSGVFSIAWPEEHTFNL